MSASVEIKVTVPEIVLNSDAVRQAILQKMQNKTGPDLRRMFEMTTRGWKTRPSFSQKFTNRVGYVSTLVWPSGNGADTYALVNNGAPAHVIRPRRRGLLRFQSGYRAATRARVLSSRASSRFGDVVTAQVVRHPGFEAREFDDTIKQEYQDTFEKDMQEAIHEATVHGIK